MSLPESTFEKLAQDHTYIDVLIQQIASLCPSREVSDNCHQCAINKRNLCRSNVEHLIQNFVQVTLKHNLLESLWMEHSAPEAHRIAHNRAHLDIAEQLDQIRAVFADDGNSLVAIEGIDRIRATLRAHRHDFDAPLEAHLKAA